jgi:hypothetical protein
MKSSITSPSKIASNFSESMHHQLGMYAIAAGAAGVSVLALAQPVEAKIVYTPVNVQVGQQYDLDLNSDGVTDFTLSAGYFNHCSKHGNCESNWHVFDKPATDNEVIAGPGGLPAALLLGAVIGHSGLFDGAEVLALFGRHCHMGNCKTSFRLGNWLGVMGNRYLGLEFQIKGKTHYGWARLSVARGATLTGYAYETLPGKAIIAGRTKGTADESGEEDFGPGASLTNPIPNKPQPASLGVLALGVQGVQLWRRKESVGAIAENNSISAFY